MPCGKGLLTTSPSSPAKAISHMVLFGRYILWIPEVVSIVCGSFAASYGAFGKNGVGTGYVFMLLFDTTFPGLKQHYNWYGAIVLPIGF